MIRASSAPVEYRCVNSKSFASFEYVSTIIPSCVLIDLHLCQPFRFRASTILARRDVSTELSDGSEETDLFIVKTWYSFGFRLDASSQPKYPILLSTSQSASRSKGAASCGCCAGSGGWEEAGADGEVINTVATKNAIVARSAHCEMVTNLRISSAKAGAKRCPRPTAS